MKRLGSVLVFVLSFVLSVVMLQQDLLLAGRTPAVFRNLDENWYGIVMQRAARDGCGKGVPVSYLFADRPNFHACEFLQVLNAVSPVKDPVDQALFLKAMTRVAMLALFCLLSFVLLGELLPGLILGNWYFLDPGIFSFKPLVVLVKNLATGESIPFVESSRYISPMQYMVPGLALAIVLLAWVRRDRSKQALSRARRVGLLACAGIAAGVLALTPFYAWMPFVYVYLCIGLYSLYFCGRATTLRIAGALGLLLVVIAAVMSRKLGFHFEDQVLPRSGFFKHQFEPLFVVHKGLFIASLAAGALSYPLFGRRKLPVVLVGLGMYVLANVNVLTGIEYQNFHFFHYLGPIVFVFAAFCLLRWKPAARPVLAGIAGCAIVLGLIYQRQIHTRLPSELQPLLSHPDHAALVEFARQELRGKRVGCGDFGPLLAVEAGVDCHYHHLLMTYPISDEELLEANVTHFKVLGKTPVEMEAILTKDIETSSIATWMYGARKEWFGGVAPYRRYGKEERLKLVPKWVGEYGGQSGIPRSVRDMEYIVLPKGHPWIGKDLESVREFVHFGVYRSRN